MDTDTVCIISRIHIGELPYINSFLDYYKRIGINKVYLVITKQDEVAPISEYLIMYESFVTYIPVDLDPSQSISMDNMNHILDIITETYTLHIDIDEFLEIAPYPNILDLVLSTNASKIHFHWAITVNDGISDITKACTGMTHRKKPYKTLCRTEDITKFTSNGHDFATRRQVREVFSENYLIHYWGRTYNDILLKAIYANGFKNAKVNTLEEVLSFIDNPDVNALPNRLKMLAMLSRLDKPIELVNNYSINYIDYAKEAELLYGPLTHLQRDTLYAKYANFRNNMDISKYRDYYYECGLLGFDWIHVTI